MGNVNWTEEAWEDYLYWQETDRKKCARINRLVRAVLRSPYAGEGKPEPLKYERAGAWSRRIDQEHRLIYRYDEESGTVTISQCRYHYRK